MGAHPCWIGWQGIPFVAEYNGEKLSPAEAQVRGLVGEDLECPTCNDRLRYRSGSWRDPSKGPRYRIAPHFFHVDETCLGESDIHRRWKTIAYDKVKAVFEESHGLDAIFLDSRMLGPYQPDVLAVFSEPDDRLGKGVAVEVQHKNPNKDVVRVQRAYLLRGFSVIWLSEEHFSDKSVDLPEPIPVWPSGVPLRQPLTDRPRDRQFSAPVTARFPVDDPVIWRIFYRIEFERLQAHIRVTRQPEKWVDKKPYLGAIRGCLGQLGFSQGRYPEHFTTTLQGAKVSLIWPWNKTRDQWWRHPVFDFSPIEESSPEMDPRCAAYVKLVQVLSCDRIGAVCRPLRGFVHRVSLASEPIPPHYRIESKDEVIASLSQVAQSVAEIGLPGRWDVRGGFCACTSSQVTRLETGEEIG